eukprot:SAG31_NODE_87_length_26728_cov_40.161591_9_plen_92_part_00
MLNPIGGGHSGRLIRRAARFFKMFQDVSRCFKMFQDVSRCFKISQDISRYLKISHLNDDADAAGVIRFVPPTGSPPLPVDARLLVAEAVGR